MIKRVAWTYFIGILSVMTSCYSFDKEVALKEFHELNPGCSIVEIVDYECYGTLRECWSVKFKYKKPNSETIYETTLQYWKKDGKWITLEDKLISINQITSNYDSLISNVTVKGYTSAYNELFYGLIDLNEKERVDSILYYSNIMADKFGYPIAYYDYLRALCEKNKIEFDRLHNLDLTNTDQQSRKIIVDWLDRMVLDKVITKEEFDLVKK
ncbi:MAG: hypothetical protein ACK5PC_17020 [Cyclobacteriaceae bacterium]|jgi:hypothetical protein|nr:hypothetical protein [Flammeovirgaceae bacterium]